ncbi:RecA-like DNA recombinase [Mycobacterium phage Benzema]|nr:RecA-like DNA recombinase [Mycobacterium phage Benzema]
MVQSKIIKVADDEDYVNLLVYGDSGVGKTVFCGSDDKVLFVAPEDNSDGLLSAKLAGTTADKWPIRDWGDLVEAYNYLDELDEIPYNWIVVDSLTEMQIMAMRDILDRAVEENPSRDPDIPQIQDWQKYYEMVKRMIKCFNALPVNVLYTALSRQTEDEEGTEYLLPDLQGKKDNYAKQVVSWMTSFGCMQIKRVRVKTDDDITKKVKEVRRITWKDTGLVTGKDRTNALTPYTDIRDVTDPEDDGLTLKDIRLRIERKKSGSAKSATTKRPARKTASARTQKESA